MAMSGVTAASDCVSAFNELRLKKCRYLILTIKDGKEIVVSSTGTREKTFEDFLAVIQPTQPCYAAFDFEYEIPEGKRDKLILVVWIPDAGKARDKMLYSSSKDALNSMTEGFQQIQANDKSDTEYDSILAKVKAHRTN